MLGYMWVKERPHAEVLIREGLPYGEIENLTGVPAGTLAAWGREIGLDRYSVEPLYRHRCSCGMLVRIADDVRHRSSALHQSGQRIVELLQGTCSFAEIGRELNLTRERVRQIAFKLGYKSGRERALIR